MSVDTKMLIALAEANDAMGMEHIQMRPSQLILIAREIEALRVALNISLSREDPKYLSYT